LPTDQGSKKLCIVSDAGGHISGFPKIRWCPFYGLFPKVAVAQDLLDNVSAMLLDERNNLRTPDLALKSFSSNY
jgi:hypothetical protein